MRINLTPLMAPEDLDAVLDPGGPSISFLAILRTHLWIDSERMAAAGASYGGYMINWIQGQTDRFKALVCHDGNLDELMAYYMTEELARDVDRSLWRRGLRPAWAVVRVRSGAGVIEDLFVDGVPVREWLATGGPESPPTAEP